MKYIIENTELITSFKDHWVIVWKELDRTNKGVNIENLAVKINNCPFCGKELKY